MCVALPQMMGREKWYGMVKVSSRNPRLLLQQKALGWGDEAGRV